MNPPDHPYPARRRWMSVLARAEAARIAELLGPPPAYTILRGPQGGLVMVRGRAGGGGAPFNLGEITVTRCTVRMETGHIGHAYVTGRDERRAELAAVVDALMQDDDRTYEPRNAERSAKAAATRVEFFAMRTMRT
jgi:alpha-D-ribose 1-methylphosphonate 5-triphosphate synthase subunit PhnG